MESKQSNKGVSGETQVAWINKIISRVVNRPGIRLVFASWAITGEHRLYYTTTMGENRPTPEIVRAMAEELPIEWTVEPQLIGEERERELKRGRHSSALVGR